MAGVSPVATGASASRIETIAVGSAGWREGWSEDRREGWREWREGRREREKTIVRREHHP